MSFEVFSFPFRVLLACLRIRKSWGGAKCTSSLFFATWRLLWAHMKCALELLWQLVWAKNDRRRSGKARRMAAAVNVMQIDARLLPRPRGCLLPALLVNTLQTRQMISPSYPRFFQEDRFVEVSRASGTPDPSNWSPKLSLLLSMFEGNCLLIKNQTILRHGNIDVSNLQKVAARWPITFTFARRF